MRSAVARARRAFSWTRLLLAREANPTEEGSVASGVCRMDLRRSRTYSTHPFHVVMLATDALDEIRREVWNEARRAGEIAAAKDLKGARFALWKNPENLTDRQQAKLAEHPEDQRAALPRLPAQGATPPDLPAARRRWRSRCSTRWIAWARRCRLAAVRQARPHDHRTSAPGSSPRSSTACPTPASKRSTPRSG